MYFDNISNVFQRLQYNTIRLEHGSLFLPPKSLFIQLEEKRLHLPQILFSDTLHSINSSIYIFENIDSNGIP